MKYMFVSQTLSRGGAERVISVLSSALTELGADVIAVKYFTTEGEYSISDRVKVLNLSGGDIKAYKGKNKLQIIYRLRKFIKENNPDCILPFTYPVAQLTEFAAAGTGVPVFQSIRINPALGPAQLWKRWLRDRLVYKSKCTFVQNEQQGKYFRINYQDRIHVLSNPVSDDFFLATPKPATSDFTISALGRLTGQKNYELLIDAFREAFLSENTVHLQIFGDGEKKESLQKYIDSKKLSAQVSLRGRTNDVLTVYQNTDVYVLSSDWEGMPNALLEAMACHVFCISTDCPTGPSDLIQNGENGILVPMKDVNALKTALLDAFSMSYEERFTMSEKARETIRNKCSSQRIANDMNAICESIIKGNNQ